MERLSAKVLSLAIAFILPLIFTILPHFVSGIIERNARRGERMLGYMLCFGGGIFLGTYLLHMAPEVTSLLNEYLLCPRGINYPVAEMIVGCGFFFILFVEKVVVRINKRRRSKKTVAPPTDNNADNAIQTLSTYVANAYDNDNFENDNDGTTSRRIESQGKVERSDSTTAFNCKVEVEGFDTWVSHDGKEAMQGRTLNEPSSNPKQLISGTKQCGTKAVEVKPCGNSKVRESLEGVLVEEGTSENNSNGGTATDANDVSVASNEGHGVRSLILMMALSLHHIFEGMSIGLQHSLQRVFTLLGAVMSHEIIINFSLGMQLVRCHYTLLRLLIAALICALFMPVGVAIGTAMMESASEVEQDGGQGPRSNDRIQLANGVLQAFAAGNFIFVTFFEILQEEIHPDDSSVGKVASAFLGFALLALVELIPSGEDGWSDCSCSVEVALQNSTNSTVAPHNYYAM